MLYRVTFPVRTVNTHHAPHPLESFMAVSTITRCKRCGTVLRNNRTVCPCCSLDVNAPPEDPSAQAAERPGSKSSTPTAEKGPKKVAAKAGVKMCQVCTSSTPEDQLVDEGGQKVCPTCAESMRTKAAKKSAPPEKK